MTYKYQVGGSLTSEAQDQKKELLALGVLAQRLNNQLSQTFQKYSRQSLLQCREFFSPYQQ